MNIIQNQIDNVEASAEVFCKPHDNGSTIWRVWGAGPPLILLHGGSGSWLHWIRNIPELSQHYQLFVPDIPGFGNSDPLTATSVEKLAENLTSGIDSFPQIKRYSIAAFSFGAWVGGHMLKQHQQRMERFFMIGAGGLGRIDSSTLGKLKSWRHLQNPQERLAAHRNNLEVLMLANQDSIDPMAIAIQSTNAEAATFRNRKSLNDMLLKECLERWPVKLSAIWGEHDAVVKNFIEERREAIFNIDPSADVETAKGAGHWVQYEATAIVNEFMLTPR